MVESWEYWEVALELFHFSFTLIRLNRNEPSIVVCSFFKVAAGCLHVCSHLQHKFNFWLLRKGWLTHKVRLWGICHLLHKHHSIKCWSRHQMPCFKSCMYIHTYFKDLFFLPVINDLNVDMRGSQRASNILDVAYHDMFAIILYASQAHFIIWREKVK